jgi:hypothetical protein
MNPANITPPPPALKHLPRDHRGYVVPFFVAWIGGKPDFRVTDPQKFRRCIADRLCWLCGGPLAKTVAFTIGPMCAINRTSAEPPSHLECALYAVKVCPFLTMPKAQRREANLPTHGKVAGVMIPRNPGVALVWVTRDRLKPFQAPGGVLFDVGNPVDVQWFAEGRAATRAEVLASIESGLPELLKVARDDQAGALDELERRRVEAMKLLPAEAA